MKHRIGQIHFVGIAGVGMSGLAELMHSRGFEVSGSDLAGGRIVEHLRGLGVRVELGHAQANANSADLVVVSTAIASDNPEVLAARRNGIPVVHRSQLLAEAMRSTQGIAISGTHGKTTTTALTTHLLSEAGLDPTALVGGSLLGGAQSRGGAIIGRGDWFVTEADESDGSFLRLAPCITVTTNIDADHLDHYGDMETLEQAFFRFASDVPFWGLSIVCNDHPTVRALADRLPGRVLRYGLETGAELLATNLSADASGSRFSVARGGKPLGEATLPLPGAHNVANALAAVAVAMEIGVGFEQIAAALATFRGVARRFEHKGSAAGIRVVDDYGHHPVEVQATLQAARAVHTGRIVTVFQPHRFTRTRDCMGEFGKAFADCDRLVIADTYRAGEAPIAGAEASALARTIEQSGHRDVRFIETLDEIAATLAGELREGDLVITLGAGDVTKLGPMLLERLAGGPPA